MDRVKMYGRYKLHAFTPHYCRCHLYSPWPAYTGHMHCHGHDVCMLGVAISPIAAVDDTSLEERGRYTTDWSESSETDQ